jgi:hypothetical protein
VKIAGIIPGFSTRNTCAGRDLPGGIGITGYRVFPAFLDLSCGATNAVYQAN